MYMFITGELLIVVFVMQMTCNIKQIKSCCLELSWHYKKDR